MKHTILFDLANSFALDNKLQDLGLIPNTLTWSDCALTISNLLNVVCVTDKNFGKAGIKIDDILRYNLAICFDTEEEKTIFILKYL